MTTLLLLAAIVYAFSVARLETNNLGFTKMTSQKLAVVLVTALAVLSLKAKSEQIIDKLVKKYRLSTNSAVIKLVKTLESMIGADASAFSEQDVVNVNGMINEFVERISPITTSRRYSMAVARILLGFSLSASPILAQDNKEVKPMTTQELLEKGDYHGYTLLGYAPGDFTSDGTDLDSHKREIGNFLKGWKPGVEKDKIGFEEVVAAMARKAVENDGAVHETFFDMYVDRHTTYVKFAHDIDKLNVNSGFKDTLKRHYVSELFLGRKPDLTEIEVMYSPVLDGAQYFTVKKGDKPELSITKAIPNFRGFPGDKQKEIMDYLSNINPGMDHIGTETDKIRDANHALGLDKTNATGVRIRDRVYYYGYNFLKSDSSAKTYTIIIPMVPTILQHMGDPTLSKNDF